MVVRKTSGVAIPPPPTSFRDPTPSSPLMGSPTSHDVFPTSPSLPRKTSYHHHSLAGDAVQESETRPAFPLSDNATRSVGENWDKGKQSGTFPVKSVSQDAGHLPLAFETSPQTPTGQRGPSSRERAASSTSTTSAYFQQPRAFSERTEAKGGPPRQVDIEATEDGAWSRQRHSPSPASEAPQSPVTNNTNPFRSRAASKNSSIPNGTWSNGLQEVHSQRHDQAEIPAEWMAELSFRDSSPQSTQPAPNAAQKPLNLDSVHQWAPEFAHDGLKEASAPEGEKKIDDSCIPDAPSEAPVAVRSPRSELLAVEVGSPVLPQIDKQLPLTPLTDEPSTDDAMPPVLPILSDRQEPFPEFRQNMGPSSDPSSSSQQRMPSLRANVEAELARMREQRNAAYQIKHFTWFDHNTRTLRRSSMLTQNENGPCPLLALVNALILSVESDSRSALGTTLRTREHVTLGLIIESLLDEITTEGREVELSQLPDVDELNKFLLMLHTGMMANPRLAAPVSGPNLMDTRNSVLHLPLSLNDDRRPGGFEETQAMRLYASFGIPLVHGWIPQRSDSAKAAFFRVAQTYEDAQAVLFGEEELEDNLARQGLSPDEQQLLQDIASIKAFLSSHPTQITPYGLDVLNESLFPGAFAILFRNDHFSTIYKHPENGQLFTLVTDAGYSDKAEVIWESLVDVTGQQNCFYSGDFRSVGNVDPGPGSSPNLDSPALDTLNETMETAVLSHQDQQHQSDADFAMALQLQEEEDAQQEQSRSRPLPVSTQSRNPPLSIPAVTRNIPTHQENRPTIPPRTSRNQGVLRPVDPNDEAPPPAYEEAAKVRPYIPPLGTLNMRPLTAARQHGLWALQRPEEELLGRETDLSLRDGVDLMSIYPLEQADI